MHFIPDRCRTENPVVHISLNPHPDDRLTDSDMENIAREYMEKIGFGCQPYMVYKHEDIDRHHMHIVTIRVKEDGKAISSSNNFYQSKKATRELEKGGTTMLITSGRVPVQPAHGRTWTGHFRDTSPQGECR